MDAMTRQNAELVEQASAAAGSLAGQAQALQGAVSVFQVNASIAQQISPPLMAEAAPALRGQYTTFRSTGVRSG